MLQLKNIKKVYNGVPILNGISLDIGKGEIVSILGPSGSGKTTLLNVILGLAELDGGQILFDGEDVSGTPMQRRGFNIVFQDYALFPHMTLYDNIAYGLKLRKTSPEAIRGKIEPMLKMLKLERAVKKYPSQLSGGMQQRAAIARSLVLENDLLLLDEPFSALDAMVKVDLSEELKELQKQFGITMIMVTHDQEEALSLSDRIILMRAGAIVADDTPDGLYASKDDPFIRSFVIDQIDKRARYIWELKGGGAS